MKKIEKENAGVTKNRKATKPKRVTKKSVSVGERENEKVSEWLSGIWESEANGDPEGLIDIEIMRVLLAEMPRDDMRMALRIMRCVAVAIADRSHE